MKFGTEKRKVGVGERVNGYMENDGTVKLCIYSKSVGVVEKEIDKTLTKSTSTTTNKLCSELIPLGNFSLKITSGEIKVMEVENGL